MNNSSIWWVILIVVILLGSYFLFVNREPLDPSSPDISDIPEVTQPLPEENLNKTLPEETQVPNNSGEDTSLKTEDGEVPAAE